MSSIASHCFTRQDSEILTACWQEQLVKPVQTPQLKQQLIEQQSRLLPRFATYYSHPST